jgi:hypothetical protein
LRAITRNLLATGTPSLAAAFTAAARSRLRQTNARRIATTNGLFTTSHNGIHAIPTQELDNALARARSLYGAGMGFASLGILSSIVKATVGLRWEEDGAMADVLAVIDADISQAMQVGFTLLSRISSANRIATELQRGTRRRARERYGGSSGSDRQSMVGYRRKCQGRRNLGGRISF